MLQTKRSFFKKIFETIIKWVLGRPMYKSCSAPTAPTTGSLHEKYTISYPQQEYERLEGEPDLLVAQEALLEEP